jgi:hypothetical protein
VSASAREKIEKAGGTVAVPEAKAPGNGATEAPEKSDAPKVAKKTDSRKAKPKKKTARK